MARTDVTAQTTSAAAALAPSFTTAITDGHMFANDGRKVIEVKNTDASPHNVEIQFGGKVDGVAPADRAHAVAATSGHVRVGPFRPEDYNQTDGKVYIDWPVITGMSIAVIDVPRVS